MRRMMLAVTGAVMGTVMLILFCGSIALQSIPVCAELPAAFPFAVEGTGLTALQLACYSGPCWERRDTPEVVTTAALLIENTGTLMVGEGAVVVEYPDRTLVFELYALPAGARVLVLEKNDQLFPNTLPTGCYGWSREIYPEDMGRISAQWVGTSALAVTNTSSAALDKVQLCIKNRDSSGTYLGGAASFIEVEDLSPGECRIIIPGGHSIDTSQIVYITGYTET